MTKFERIHDYERGMQRLQHLWAYLLKRKMRLYR